MHDTARPVGVRPPPAHVTREVVGAGSAIGPVPRQPPPPKAAPRKPGPHDPAGDIQNWQDNSPLTLMGYRVGKTKGLVPAARQSILRRAVEDHLPNAFPADYAEAWGTPGTRARYDRICQHLALMIEVQGGRASMRHAVADWTADLGWLKATFGPRFR